MRGYAKHTIRALLCTLPTLVAWTPANPTLTLQPQSRLWVRGTSTVRDFECRATAFDVRVEAAPNAVTGVLAGEQAVTTASVRVPADRLDCGNGKMNDHMWKALKRQQYPDIAFRLTGYETATASAGVQGTVTGVLALGGVERTITLQGNAVAAPDGALRVTGTHELRMSEYGLKAPTLMMGTLKVGDRVTVAFDLLLKD
ncbi:MAG TPA: YceI family protein [Gemmatimonadaceae bacterium]|nr:YceI family protein [Gemmatimonadaceae bacterium]